MFGEHREDPDVPRTQEAPAGSRRAGPEALGMAPVQNRLQDLVPGSANPHLIEVNLLEPVSIPEECLQALRRIRLTHSKHIGVVLHVGVETQVGDADVTVQQVTSADHIVTPSIPLLFD